ncbi:MAG TPA: hypothetical protein VHZ96_13970, partial [Frankiaceae bacterium]|nr:hypothetical protein [Frankiaceae bacterium]
MAGSISHMIEKVSASSITGPSSPLQLWTKDHHQDLFTARANPSVVPLQRARTEDHVPIGTATAATGITPTSWT